MLLISDPRVYWGFFALAAVASLSVGLGAYAIFNVPEAERKQRFYQYFLNTLGAAAGWMAAWVVIVRWFGCPGFVCHEEPTGWTILLAVIAMIGMVGHLPIALLSGVAAIKDLLSRMLKA